MNSSSENKLKFREVKWGSLKLRDGSTIILRAGIIDARVREENTPFKVEFDVNVTVGLSVYPSKDVLEEIKDKPLLESNKIITVTEGWVQVDITDKVPAYEEVIYEEEKIGKYLLKVEIEPLMVSKNTKYKIMPDTPIYVVRWVPKVTWNEIKNDER